MATVSIAIPLLVLASTTAITTVSAQKYKSLPSTDGRSWSNDWFSARPLKNELLEATAYPITSILPDTEHGGGVRVGDDQLWMMPGSTSLALSVMNITDGTFTSYNDRWPPNYKTGTTYHQFNGAVYDGKYLWMIPYASLMIVRVNPLTGNMTGFEEFPSGISRALANRRFSGAVYDGRGGIWMTPMHGTVVAKLDTNTAAMTGYGNWPNFDSYSAATLQHTGAAFDGKYFWMAPRSGDWVVGVNTLDPSSGNMLGYKGWPSGILFRSDGYVKFLSLLYIEIFASRSLFLIPCAADAVVKLDINGAGTSTGTGPLGASSISTVYTLYKDWSPRVRQYLNHSQSTLPWSKTLFSSAVYDGERIWMPPRDRDLRLVVSLDPVTGSFQEFDSLIPTSVNVPESGAMFYGAAIDQGGLWFIPQEADAIVRVKGTVTDTSTVTLTVTDTTEPSVSETLSETVSPTLTMPSHHMHQDESSSSTSSSSSSSSTGGSSSSSFGGGPPPPVVHLHTHTHTLPMRNAALPTSSSSTNSDEASPSSITPIPPTVLSSSGMVISSGGEGMSSVAGIITPGPSSSSDMVRRSNSGSSGQSMSSSSSSSSSGSAPSSFVASKTSNSVSEAEGTTTTSMVPTTTTTTPLPTVTATTITTSPEPTPIPTQADPCADGSSIQPNAGGLLAQITLPETSIRSEASSATTTTDDNSNPTSSTASDTTTIVTGTPQVKEEEDRSSLTFQIEAPFALNWNGNISVGNPIPPGSMFSTILVVAEDEKPNPAGFSKYPPQNITLVRLNTTWFQFSMLRVPLGYSLEVDESLEIVLTLQWFQTPQLECPPTQNIPIFRLRVTTVPNPAVERTKTATSVIGGTATAAATVASAGAAMDAQSLAVIALMSCASPAEREAMKNNRLLSPLAPGDSYEMMILGNVILVTIVLLLHWLSSVIYAKVKKSSMEEARAFVRFPTFTLVAVTIQYQGTAAAAVKLVQLNYSPDASKALGGIFIVISFALPIGLFVLARLAVKKASYRHYDFNAAPVEQRMSAVMRAILPSGSWHPASVRRRFSALFAGLQRNEKIWVTLPTWSPTVIVIGLLFQPSDETGCAAQFAVMAAVQYIFVIVLLAFRPYRTLPANILAAASNLCLGLVFTGSAVLAKDPESESAQDMVLTCVQLQLAVTLLRLVWTAIQFGLEMKYLGESFPTLEPEDWDQDDDERRRGLLEEQSEAMLVDPDQESGKKNTMNLAPTAMVEMDDREARMDALGGDGLTFDDDHEEGKRKNPMASSPLTNTGKINQHQRHPDVAAKNFSSPLAPLSSSAVSASDNSGSLPTSATNAGGGGAGVRRKAPRADDHRDDFDDDDL